MMVSLRPISKGGHGQTTSVAQVNSDFIRGCFSGVDVGVFWLSAGVSALRHQHCAEAGEDLLMMLSWPTIEAFESRFLPFIG